MDDMKNAFEEDVISTIALYKKIVGGFTPATDRILNNSDKVSAVSKLMASAEVQTGFKTLRNNNKLDKTFEALVIKYKELFRADVIEAAQWRLDNAWQLEPHSRM